MARKSRSKQRGKGVGSRSQSAGKSKGGSRSSAGSAGGSKSGGNRSGSGARGNKGSKSTSSKGTSSRSSSKSKSPSNRSPSTKTPTKKYKRPPTTLAQKRFREREAAGLSGLTGGPKGESMSQYRARQREQVQNAALGRRATSLTGIPSGKNLPAGSFGISEAGRAQAEANRTEAREKKIAAMSPRNQALARQAYAKYGTINPTFADTFGATSGDLRNPLNAPNYAAAMGAGYTDSVVGGLNFAKNLIPGVKQLPNIPTLPAYNDARLQNLRNISSFAIPGAQLTSSLSNLGRLNSIKGLASPKLMRTLHGTDKNAARSILSSLKNPANIGKTFREAPGMLGKGAYQSRFGNIATSYQGGLRGTAFGAKDGVNIQAIVPRGARTLGGATVTSGKQLDRGTSIASGVLSGKYTGPKAMQIKAMLNAPAPKSGGVLSGGAATTGLTGASAMSTKAVKAGGLNIGSEDSEGTGNNNLARALSFAAKNPGAVAQDAGMIAGELASGDLSIGDITQGIGDYRTVMAGDTFRDKVENFANLPNERKENYLTKGLDLADRSAIVQRIGEQAGLPSDFKAQTKELGGEIGRRLATVKAGDRDSTYKAISDFSRDIGTDPKLGLAGRMAESFRTRKGTTMEKIASGYDKNSPTIKGLSAAERGIVGSVGNRIISGKATDMAREAMSGMTPGASLTRGNIATIGTNIMRDTAPGADTVSAKRASEIKSLVTGGSRGRDITPGSLLRGVNPFRRSGQGGSNILSRPGGGGTTTAPVGQLPQVPNPAQVELPVIPQQQEQQGTQASTLAGIQNQSYENTFNNLMAQFRPRRMGRRRNFRTSFNRDYFSQFV